ncbi:MAG: DUF1569 domain-containing protein [Candidatus Hydrogenedentota bacterium]
MHPFDHDYAEEVIERLGNIPPNAVPRWGRLTQEQLYGHLTSILQYSMGRNGKPLNHSTWFMRHIIRPLVLRGILPIPKNVKMPEFEPIPDGDLETLQAVLEEYLNLVQADELEPYPHVYFGELGVDGWARLHVIHFEHHLRQFGV